MSYSQILDYIVKRIKKYFVFIADALLVLSDINPQLLMKKVKANMQLYRNKAAYERLSSHIEKMLKWFSFTS